MARSHMALGIGYSMQAIEARLQAERLALYKQALMSFKV